MHRFYQDGEFAEGFQCLTESLMIVFGFNFKIGYYDDLKLY